MEIISTIILNIIAIDDQKMEDVKKMEIASVIIIDCFGVWAIIALIAAAVKRGY